MKQTQPDKMLFEEICKGSESAFKELFQKYFQYLHNVAYNRLRSVETADDIVQDIFTELWKNREHLNIHTSVSSYLYQAVKNKVYNFIRHQSVREKEIHIQRIHDEYYERTPFQEGEGMMEERELKELVCKHLDTLPTKSRDIFNLSRKKKYTHKEIAEELDCSQKTVEYHIGKTLKHLRLHLKDYVTIFFPFGLLLLQAIQ